MIQKNIELGPIHEFLPGAMKIGLGLSGDEIVSVDTEFGYLAKNLIPGSIGTSIFARTLRLSRLEPESALIIDQMLCGCIEEAMEFEVNPRAEWVRLVAKEMCDLIGILKYLALMSKRMKLASLMQVLLRHREDLVDLLELLTGSRFGYDYIIPGGVRFDLSHGLADRLDRWIHNYLADFDRIESLFYWVGYHRNFLSHLGSVADRGDLGFVSRANKDHTRLGPVSNVRSRLDFGLSASVSVGRRLLELLNAIPEGRYHDPVDRVLRKTQLRTEMETQRGVWQFYFEFESNWSIQKIEVNSPSDQSIKALPEALMNENIDDLPLIMQSLNFIVAEIDK